MGNVLSLLPPYGPMREVERALAYNRARPASEFRRKDLHCSSRDQLVKSTTWRATPKSHPRDTTKVGFLDLPGELRNNIYSRLLVCEGYVRVANHGESTKVPALALLRTCKQVHHEAAGIFYGANSFYFNIEMFADIPGDVSSLRMAEICSRPWERIQTNDELDAGGVLFPAPRYHIWLTRLTIDVKITDNSHLPIHSMDYAEYHSRGENNRSLKMQLHEFVSKVFCEQYNVMKALWEEKNSNWKGRMIGDVSWEYSGALIAQTFRFTFAFSEDEADECATKGAFRSWDLKN